MKTLRLLQLAWPLGSSEVELRELACRELGLDPARLRGFRIVKQAVDARRRGGLRRLRYVGHLDVVVDAGFRSGKLARLERGGRVTRPAPPAKLAAPRVHPSIGGGPGAQARLVIVGAGPAGLAAALVCAESGVPCTVLERGPAVRERSLRLVRFHRKRELDPEANLLYGEGGAGTYSDGKIYTRVDDPLELPLLEALVAAGAPPAISYDSLAHIGTDRLHKLLPRLRARLEAGGTRFVWNARVEGFVCDARTPRRVRALRTTAGEFACDAVLLATGHSARDTWRWLADAGALFEPRPFQLGVRIEHPQELIDRARWGDGPEAAWLGAASYNLVAQAAPAGRGAHSFCMCPGGRIVASVQAPGLVCTNGMSNSRHSSGRATAALVTTLGPADYGAHGERGTGSADPFSGVRLQEVLERRFFDAGGGTYAAPAQSAADFIAGRPTRAERRTTYPFGAVTGKDAPRVDALLPPLVRTSIAHALERFERMIPGFASDAGLLVGIETRSSNPVRMPRDAERRALGFANLFPLGEGAGFAGGIMSAMIDGAHAARDLLCRGTS